MIPVQRIKTLKVVCSEQVQAADTFIANAAVRASLINTITGEIDPGRRLVATILSAQGSVTTDKVFDTFTVQLAVSDIATGQLVDDCHCQRFHRLSWRLKSGGNKVAEATSAALL